MSQRMALYMQDRHPIAYELEMARYAESKGFSEIWQADTRLARDCVVLMSAFLARTQTLRLGSGVLPLWTRNPAVIAATWSTLWELAGRVNGKGRVMLGLGAWWEPIAGRVGVNRRKPLTAMREHIEAIRALFSMEEVTYQGEFVRLDRVRLDVAYGDTSHAISRSTSAPPATRCSSWRVKLRTVWCSTTLFRWTISGGLWNTWRRGPAAPGGGCRTSTGPS